MPTKPKTIKQAPKPVNIYRKIAYTFIGIAVVLLVVIFYFTFVSVKIRVTPAKEKISFDFIIKVKEGGPTVDEQISGHVLNVTKTAKTEVSSTYNLTGEPAVATGKVKLINTSNGDQPLVATTRLLSPENILFRIKKSVVVPAQGEIEVEVYADKPGVESEISPTKFTIPGLAEARQKVVYAQSFEDMTGGTKGIYQVTDEDISRAEKSLIKQLSDEAVKGFETALPQEEILLPFAVYTEIIKSDVDAKVGDKVEKFNLNLEIKIITASVNKEDLKKLAYNLMSVNVPVDKELTSVDTENLNFVIQTYDSKNNSVLVKMTVGGEMAVKSSSPIFNKEKLIGLNAQEVKTYLESFTSISSVEIDLWPFWVRTIPKLKDHIKIEVLK